jgi:hypothetical protein
MVYTHSGVTPSMVYMRYTEWGDSLYGLYADFFLRSGVTPYMVYTRSGVTPLNTRSGVTPCMVYAGSGATPHMIHMWSR